MGNFPFSTCYSRATISHFQSYTANIRMYCSELMEHTSIIYPSWAFHIFAQIFQSNLLLENVITHNEKHLSEKDLWHIGQAENSKRQVSKTIYIYIYIFLYICLKNSKNSALTTNRGLQYRSCIPIYFESILTVIYCNADSIVSNPGCVYSAVY